MKQMVKMPICIIIVFAIALVLLMISSSDDLFDYSDIDDDDWDDDDWPY